MKVWKGIVVTHVNMKFNRWVQLVLNMQDRHLVAIAGGRIRGVSSADVCLVVSGRQKALAAKLRLDLVTVGGRSKVRTNSLTQTAAFRGTCGSFDEGLDDEVAVAILHEAVEVGVVVAENLQHEVQKFIAGLRHDLLHHVGAELVARDMNELTIEGVDEGVTKHLAVKLLDGSLDSVVAELVNTKFREEWGDGMEQLVLLWSDDVL